VTAIAPPRPLVAAPEPSHTCPLLPLEVLPVLKTSEPDAPFEPALVVRKKTEPLLVAVPSPLDRLSRPPVLTVLRPACP